MSDSGPESLSRPVPVAVDQVLLKWPPLRPSKKPKGVVWKYFIQKNKDGIPYWECVFCNTMYLSPHATRMRNHILRCLKAPEDARKVLGNGMLTSRSHSQPSSQTSKSKRGHDSDEECANSGEECYAVDSLAAPNEMNNNSPETTAKECSYRSFLSLSLMSDSDGQSDSSRNSIPRCSSSFQESEKRGGLYDFLDTMSSNEQHTLDQLFARAVYSSGVPFQTLSANEEWQTFFKHLRPAFKPPTRQKLAGALLNEEYSHVEKSVDEKLEESSVLCLQCDGWSNRRNEAIINYIINTPKPVFYKMVETKLARHSADYFSEEMEQIIKKIGVDKFEACITDNAAVMIACTSKIAEKYPHISAYTCASHSINLLVQDILKLGRIEEVTNNCIKIVKTINRSRILKAAFVDIPERENPQSVHNSLLPVKTRRTSCKLSFRSLLKTSQALKMLCINEKTKHLLKPDVRALILDKEFWNRVEMVHNLTDVAATWAVKLQDDIPSISSVFKAFLEIDTTIKKKLEDPNINQVFTSSVIDRINTIVSSRKLKSLKPIHYAAYLLDPKYHGANMSADEDILAMEFIDQKIRQTFSDTTDVSQVAGELAQYKCSMGFFAKPFVVSAVNITDPLVWWKGTCFSTKLKLVAEKILSPPATTAATKKSFSIQGLVHCAKRNRLKAVSARKFTFINYNLRLDKSKLKKKQCGAGDSGSDGYVADEEPDNYDRDDSDYDLADWSHFPVDETEEIFDEDELASANSTVTLTPHIEKMMVVLEEDVPVEMN